MKQLTKDLYITYSNQKMREIKRYGDIGQFDRVITLESMIVELFEKKNFEIIIDEMIASSVIYNIIVKNDIEYFSYLDEDSLSLKTIYDFIVRCRLNSVEFDKLLSGEKLDAMVQIDKAYQEYKIAHALVDKADIESIVLEHWDRSLFDEYDEIYVDNFLVGDINFAKTKKQKELLKKLSIYKKIKAPSRPFIKAKIIQPNHEVFDNIDEVKTAIKIARKLLEDGAKSEDILIVSTNIKEYAPLYKLFLDEYKMKGYSSLGTPLSSFYSSDKPEVQQAIYQYNSKIESVSLLYKKFNITLNDNIKKNIKDSIVIHDERTGIEITESNQIVGLTKSYKHIIFIGTDINHFPAKANDNFLYSYEDDVRYFSVNDYFKSARTQLEELKRISENLYIITASYSGKRELTPSILIDKKFDGFIDISDIKSTNQLALESKTVVPDEKTKEFYESITLDKFTKFDGVGVDGVKATHLSASQINKYISCPLSYLYINKLKLKAPNKKDDGFDAMEKGSLMHLCYELFGRYIKENSLTSVDKDNLYTIMYNISNKAFASQQITINIYHKLFFSELQAGLKDARSHGLLAKFVDYYIKNAKEFNYFQESEFEKEFALDSELQPYTLKNKEDKNYFIKGFIDRFDDLGKIVNIVDYKSKKITSNKGDTAKQEEVDTQKDIQLALYILYAKQAYKGKTYDAHLLSFKGNEKGIKLATLSNSDTYDDNYEKNLKKLIFDIKEHIENGDFAFDNSDEKMCEWCDIKSLCHQDILRK